MTALATVTRRIHPQMARPVADRAGLRCSTVSVKAAIHGAYAAPSQVPVSASRIAMEEKVGEPEPAFDRNAMSTATLPRAPARMSGLRVRRVSDSAPNTSMDSAIAAHIQFNSEFDWLAEKLRSVW